MSFQSKLQKIRDQIYEFRQRTSGFPVLHKVFFKNHGYPLNLKNPTTNCERINHKKIYDRNPLIPITSDKYRVKDYVRQKLGNELAEKILIPLYHVSKTGLDIPFEDWNFEFFLKANHYSGGNLLVKPGTNPKELREKCRTWLNSSFGQNLHEWGYRDIPRRIICEKILRDANGNLPNDYKFYCYQGKVEMIGFVKDRFEGLKTTFTDLLLNPIGGPVGSDTLLNEIPEIPNLQSMISISEALANGFSHVRIDLYSFENQVYFGEITHYSGSGLDKYDSFELDQELGRKWIKKKSLCKINYLVSREFCFQGFQSETQKMLSENFIKKNLLKLRDRLTQQRHKILNYPTLHKVFFEKHGYPLNLKNPKTFSELINHKKILDRDPLIPITSDKYRVRDYVRQKLGNELAEKILIPLYHVSKTGLDIPFEDWNFEFFLKANHYSGGNLLVKPGTNPKELREKCRTWLNSSFGQNLHEWGYRDIPRRIICEKILRDANGNLPNDYKFYCFNGEVEMITVIKDRFSQKKIKYTLDPDFHLLDGPYLGNEFPEKVPEIPNFKQMVGMARSLSADFSHVRIDFYSFEDQVFFGEITQYTGSGLVKMSSYEFDLQLGAKWLKKAVCV